MIKSAVNIAEKYKELFNNANLNENNFDDWKSKVIELKDIDMS